MGWFSWFSAAPKAVDDVLDKKDGLLSQLGNWIGGMNLTKEEVIEFNASTVANVHTFVKATLSESTERSKTRRSIAILWIKSQLALVLMSCIAAPWNMDLAEFYYKMATSTLMITGTTAVIIFFFGSHGVARYNESKGKE